MKTLLFIITLLPLYGYTQSNLTGIIGTASAGLYASEEDGKWTGVSAGINSRSMALTTFFAKSMHDVGERYRYGGELTIISPNQSGFRGFGFLRLDKNWDKFTATQAMGTENGLYDSYFFTKLGAGLTYVINPSCQVMCPGNDYKFITAPSIAIFYADNNAPNKWGYKAFYVEAGLDISYQRLAMSIRYAINLGACFRLSYYIL